MTQMQPTTDAAQPSRPAPVILCVDDEPHILSALRRLFRSTGWTVRVADSGASGLQILDTESVDLVISDMRMPNMNGAEFLAQVRARWPLTVRLLLTGHSDVNAIVDAINRGEIYRYITKPWDDNDIVLLVRHALERKALEQEKRRLEALTQSQNEALESLNAALETKVNERTLELAAANEALKEANEKLKANFVTSIKVFSALIEMRGGSLAGHSRRTAEMCRKIGAKMGLETPVVKEIFIAGLLHEIGKIGFTDELLAMPVSTLSGAHLDQYRNHPSIAEQLLMPLQDLQGAAAMIGAQLERFDGTGTPKRLAAEAIPIGARILALASDYDSFQIGAFAKRALTEGDIKTLLLHGSGKRYDPAVIAAFMSVLGGDATEVSAEQARETAVSTHKLEAGMVLSRDLIGPGGMLMLSADHTLDTRMIEKLTSYARAGRLHETVHVWMERKG